MKSKLQPIHSLYAWLALFSASPFLLLIVMSVFSKGTVHMIGLPLTLNNYNNLFSSLFSHVLIRSLTLSVITTMLCLCFAYPFSYLLVRSRFKTILLLLIIIPFWTSSLIRTYALLALLKYNGIINSILLKINLINTPLELLYSNFSVLSGLTYSLFPFMVLPLFNSMDRFDFQLFEAAKDLGAKPRDLFFRVFLPHTQRAILSGCTLVFLPAMTLFYIPNILGGARAFMLGNLIQSQFLETGDWPQGAATSVFLMGFVILLFALRLKKRRTR